MLLHRVFGIECAAIDPARERFQRRHPLPGRFHTDNRTGYDALGINFVSHQDGEWWNV